MSQYPYPLDSNPIDPKSVKLEHLRRVSFLWDKAFRIPGTNFRFGLDSIIGLLPGGGDLVGLVFSFYVLLQAVQLGVPKSAFARMVFNILLDGAVGLIPFVGDIFDTTWKANTRNVKLLEEYLVSPTASRKADKRFLILLLAITFVLVIFLAAACVIILRLFMQALFGSP